MGKTKSFSSWEEASEYILKNCEKSCLNCDYGTKGKKADSPYVFCIEPQNGFTMANLNFGVVCKDWKKMECDNSE